MPSQAPRQIKTIVGSNIQAARTSLNLTQAQLAQRMSIEPMSISRWERGRVMPSFQSLVALGDALGRDMAWLTTDHEKDAAA